MKKWNKKGMMDDFFDFIFTTVSLFFLLFFISLVFNGSVNSSHETSAENVADFKIKDAAINNLLLQNYLTEVNIDKIDSSISKSNLWNGKVITSCTDYTTEKDCESDPMGKGGGFCNWASSFCYYGNPAIMVG